MSRPRRPQWVQALWLWVQTFFWFSLLISFVLTCSLLLYFSQIEPQRGLMAHVGPLLVGNIFLLSAIMATIDLFRRRWMIRRPVEEILATLRRLQQGDFTARAAVHELIPTGNGFAEIGESINLLADELAGVETLRTDFIANVSHELKTPLAVMQNYATMLQSPALPEAERLEYAAAIRKTCRRLTELVTNILRLNKLENPQIYPDARSSDLSGQLYECLLNYETVLDEKQLETQLQIPDDVTVTADPELLALVWNNLLSNAVKFTPAGGTIGVTLCRTGDWLEVSISDTGCGMTPEVGRHIFEKFYQGDTSHSGHGNGLGLALVRRVVQITRGEIRVDSVPGKGSTFTVRLRQAGA
ncbi:MAG: HAMP domain-containing histidine kinase [Faecalibacterium sp.]|nr:HAMP domain-containing histidine kinase [Faecalibacterium sp.]